MIGGTPNVLVVNSALPVKTLAEFIDYVKKPRAVNYGSAGPGSLTHLTMELFKQEIGALHAAHPVSRHRAGVHRPARRADAGHVPGPRRSASAPPVGPRARSRGHRPPAAIS